MFIGYYELNKKQYFNLYFEDIYNIGDDGWKIWHEETFSPACKNIKILNFKATGKTYKEKKESIKNLAIEWQNDFADLSWSYGELAEIQKHFYINAKKYGLLKEFKENCIV